MPHRRYEDIFIPIHNIKWDKTEVMSETTVCLYSQYDLDTRELMTALCDPDSDIATLLATAKKVTLCVSYWVLVDLRDPTLDAEQLTCRLEDPDMPDEFPDTELDESTIIASREILQAFTNLHVYLIETDMNRWERCCFARYAGVVRTFKNISDYDYSLCDKYGPAVQQNLQQAYDLYGVTTDRVVYLHGIDDWCFAGAASEKYRYIELAQEGAEIEEADWKYLDPFVTPYLTYMKFRNFPISLLPGAVNYPELRELCIESSVVDVPRVVLPDCPNLKKLEICFDEDYAGYNGDVEIIIEGCRKLRDTDINFREEKNQTLRRV